MTEPIASRRAFLRAALSLPAGAMLAACVAPAPPPPTPQSAADTSPTAALDEPTAAVGEEVAAQPMLEPTPACGDDDDEPTLAQTAGPYYTPNTPERVSFLEANVEGDRLLLDGLVVTTTCVPVAQALVDFWHCDAAGVYDNQGYTLRGHQFTDDQGRYRLETVVPGIYPGRTRHIHVKVQAPNGPVLTTQLYFPDEPQNARDGIFHPSLVVELGQDPDAMLARFNFVLA